MSYKVDYGIIMSVGGTREIEVKRRKGGFAKWLILGVAAIFLVVCATTDILIPGDAFVTKAAMRNFLSDIQGGEQVVDAFASFCQTVLQGG